MKWTFLFLACSLFFTIDALSNEYPSSKRRSLFSKAKVVLPTLSSVIIAGCTPLPSWAQQEATSSSPRFVDVGGGFDLFAPSFRLEASDVLFPPSCIGLWACQRAVFQADGNTEQGETVWRLLGGGIKNWKQQSEMYLTKFVPSASSDYVVLDRGYDMQKRQKDDTSVIWNAENPDTLSYSVSGTKIELRVVQRSIEMPSEKGWGSNELIRITSTSTSPSALLNSIPITRVARVRRRFRRALDEKTGDRVIEGLEIVNTYRVLDGIAGTEYPTSTTKSQMRFTRPSA